MHRRITRALKAVICLVAFGAAGQSGIPDSARTPGATDPNVTQESIRETICRSGWAHIVRPPFGYLGAVKRHQLTELDHADTRMRDYEEDHLIPLDLGGAPSDPKNLWPQPRDSIGEWNADKKGRITRVLNGLVCQGRMPLSTAQRLMATNWTAAYSRFVIGRVH